MLDRRRRVAVLRLRGLSLREITKALPMGDGGVINPETQKPYNMSTIYQDLKAIEQEWRQMSVADLQEHKARHLAELAEVRRTAWQQGKLFYILKSLEQEAQILGLNEVPDAPDVNVNVANFDLSGMPTDELRRISQVINSARSGAIGPGDTAGVIEAG